VVVQTLLTDTHLHRELPAQLAGQGIQATRARCSSIMAAIIQVGGLLVQGHQDSQVHHQLPPQRQQPPPKLHQCSTFEIKKKCQFTFWETFRSRDQHLSQINDMIEKNKVYGQTYAIYKEHRENVKDFSVVGQNLTSLTLL